MVSCDEILSLFSDGARTVIFSRFICSSALLLTLTKEPVQKSERSTDVADALMDDVDNDVTSCRIIDVIH